MMGKYKQEDGAMKKITVRSYRMLQDFQRVETFLRKEYQKTDHNGYLLPEFWEYAHTHPMFNPYKAHRMGLWEEEGELVGIAAYEMDLGSAFLLAKRGYEDLYEEMLAYAQKELSVVKDGVYISDVWTTEQQKGVVDLLEKKSYEMVHKESITIYDYDRGFEEPFLPEGFEIFSLEDENDYKKIHECLWKGFDHGDHPDKDIDRRRLMQSGPNFRRDLSMVVKAPDGSYASFAGMWLNEDNHYAYLEPLATVPEYRKLGLGKALLMRSMEKTKSFGTTYCYGGPMKFYYNLGFENAGMRRKYRKVWRDEGIAEILKAREEKK